MKILIKRLYQKLPFRLKFWIDRYLRRKIEEVELVYYLLKDRKEGTMIDVGAHYGTSLEAFMKDGWSVYAFEPDPKNRKELLRTISGRNNVIVNTQAVSNQSDLELSFYSSDVSTGISGLSNFHRSHKEIAKVKTITLKDFLNKQPLRKIDFLKIDTEGHDLFVLQGFDWINHPHPDVILCEFENNKSIPLGYSTEEMKRFLEVKEYKVIISEWYPIIEYGSNHRFNKFVNGTERIGKDSWGNLICFKKNVNFNIPPRIFDELLQY